MKKRGPKRRLAIPILVALLCLTACSAREQNQPTPEPSATPTVMIPNVVIETPTPTPTPTADPYCGIRRTWLEAVVKNGFTISPPAIRRGDGSTEELTDTVATGERENPNSMEEQILSGEAVLLKSGVEIDLDGNGTREEIRFGSEKDRAEFCVGPFSYTTRYGLWFTGNVYGVCLQTHDNQFLVVVEYTDMYDEQWPKGYIYSMYVYRQQEQDTCWGGWMSDYETSELVGLSFSPEGWEGNCEGCSFSSNGQQYMYMTWQEDVSWQESKCYYAQIFAVPDGMQPVGRFATVQTDVFSYNEYTKELDAYIPAGNKVYVIAQNDEWLYVADCKYTAEAYVKISDDGGETIVHAPQKVTLEEALVYEEE